MEFTKTHILANANKNYLGHWDIPESGELIGTIKTIKWEMVVNPRLPKNDPQKSVEKRVIRWTDSGIKPMIVNQGNSQNIISAIGEKWMEDMGGKKIRLFIGKYYDNKEKETIDRVEVDPKPVTFVKINFPVTNPKILKRSHEVYKEDADYKRIETHYKLTVADKKRIKDGK